jgi:hypothetical protein
LAKLTLATITSGYGSVDRLNANSDLIEEALENTLSRDGTSPNQMEANLDMNTNRILNLPAPENATEPLRLGDLSSGAGTLVSEIIQNAADAAQSAADASSFADASEVSAAAADASADAAAASAAEVEAALLWQDVVFITSANSPYTIVESTHKGKLIAVDASGGAVSIVLPGISTLTLPFTLGVKKVDSGGNAVTITPNGTDTIDSAASKSISVSNAGAAFYPDIDTTPDGWVTTDFGSAAGNLTVDTFSGDGSDVTFDLSVSPGNENNTFVFIDGVYQQKSEYSISGVTLTFTAAPPVGTDNIQVVIGTTLSIGTPADDTVSTAKIVDGAVTAAKLASDVGGFTTGDVKLSIKTTADSGWVVMNDGTIGNASSGGTTRANADTEDLFTLLWTVTADAQCAVSTGRGASAAADFAANKTIALPKALGRAMACYGSGSGLTARALAETTGTETHTLTQAQTPLKDHTHQQRSATAGGGVTLSQFVAGTGDQGTNTNTSTSGSSTADAHPNMQPTLFLNVHIKL